MRPLLRKDGGCWCCAMPWPHLWVPVGYGKTEAIAYADWLDKHRGKGDSMYQGKPMGKGERLPIDPMNLIEGPTL